VLAELSNVAGRNSPANVVSLTCATASELIAGRALYMNSESAAWAIATAHAEGLESDLAKSGNRWREIFKLKATSAKGLLIKARVRCRRL
jgi:hypothetical protein